MILITVSIFSLLLTAVCYFFSRSILCIIFASIFIVSNTVLAHTLLYEQHAIIFFLLIAICVIFPVSCLISFLFDIMYGIFCIDTSFSLVIAWAFLPLLLPINLILVCLEN
ncbi:MAG: hypothetical protein D8M57_10055 [Candidatus Scalindua sp. AMX11]|nr:MAG: hypothetical protein DWQ00_08805 [Candidatus Scalindua sp.]TDE65088.1 MAG: hypothetical protein D8M57_10055 [Candidatus Scalindua sp. AMX11]